MESCATAESLGDLARFRALMESFHRYGGAAGAGIHRLALSSEDGGARDHQAAWMREQGLKVSVDPTGNLFELLEWAGTDTPVVMTGSHLDGQPTPCHRDEPKVWRQAGSGHLAPVVRAAPIVDLGICGPPWPDRLRPCFEFTDKA